MARRPIEQRIAELEEQAKALKARLAKTERANETRRKIILGALVQDRMSGDDENGKWLRDWLQRELPGYLTRDHDREIFSGLLSAGDKGDAGSS